MSLRSVLIAVSLTLLGPTLATSAQTAPDPPVRGDGTMTMALTGDAIITRALSPYTEPDYLRMIDVVRSADLAFTNLEVLLHDYEPYPAHQSGLW